LYSEYLFQHNQQLSQSSAQVSKILELVMSMALKMNSEDPKTTRFDDNGIYSPYKADAIAWYGQFRCKPGQDCTMPYFRDRRLLADLTWAGHWSKAMKLLKRAREDYKQNWINCTSLCE
jgi:hypothetical protein